MSELPYFQPGKTFGAATLKEMVATEFTAFRAAMQGDHITPGDRVIRLIVNGELWMSDSKDEFWDHYQAMSDAHGRVLIHGLGLGCYLNAILASKDVTHVDVVEINKDVIGLVGPFFEQDERVHIHHANAFTKEWPVGTRWNYVWHDIWANKCTDDLSEHAKLNRKFGNRTDRQGCWAHEWLLWQRRRERRAVW